MANKVPQIHALGAGDYSSKNKGTFGDVVSQVPAVLDTIGALFTKVLPGIITYGANEVVDLFRPKNEQYNGTLNDWVTKDGWVAQLRGDSTGSVVNYEDPYEINTILDAIAPGHNSAVAAKYGEDNALNRVKAMFTSVRDFTIKPLLLGEFGKLGINTLMSLGEGLDAVANPVKAALAFKGSPFYQDSYFEDYDVALSYVEQVSQELCQVNYDENGDAIGYTVKHPVTGKIVNITTNDYENYVAIVNAGRTANIANMNTLERVKSAVGLGDRGRINYNIDTGSTVTDFLGEFLLDPSMWLTLGASFAGKGAVKATKAATKTVLTEFAATGSKEFSEAVLKAGEEKIVREVLDAYTSKTITLAKNSDALPVVQKILKEASHNAVEHSFKVKNARSAIQAVLAKNGIDIPVSDNTALEIIKAALNKNKQTMLHTVTSALDTTDKTLSKAMWWLGGTTTGLAPTVALLKKGRGAVARNLSNAIENTEAIYVDDYGAPSIMNFNDQKRIFKQTVDNSSKGMRASEQVALDDELSVDIYALQSANVTGQINKIMSDTYAPAVDQLEQINAVLQRAYKTTDIDTIIAKYEAVAAEAPNASFIGDTIVLLKQLDETIFRLKNVANCDVTREVFNAVVDGLHLQTTKNSAPGFIRSELRFISDTVDALITKYAEERGVAIFSPRLANSVKKYIDDIITQINTTKTIAPELQENITKLKDFNSAHAHILDNVDKFYTYTSVRKKYTQLLENLKRQIDELVQSPTDIDSARAVLRDQKLWSTDRNKTIYEYLIDKEGQRLSDITTDLHNWEEHFERFADNNATKYIPTEESDILNCVKAALNVQNKAAEVLKKLGKDIKLPAMQIAGSTQLRPKEFDDLLKKYFLRNADAESTDDIVSAVRSIIDEDRTFIKKLLDAENNEFLSQQIDDVFNSNPILLLLDAENAEHAIDAAAMVTYNDALHSLVYQLENLRKDAFAEAQDLSKVTDRTPEMQKAHVAYSQEKTADVDARIAKLNEQRNRLIKQYNKESETTFTDDTVSFYYDEENDKLLVQSDPKVDIIEKIHALDKQIKNTSKEYDKVAPGNRSIEAANIKEQRLKDIDDALTRLEYYALPTEAVPELIAFEEVVAFKLSQVAATEMLLDSKSGLQEYIDLFNDPAFIKLENAIYSIQQTNIKGTDRVAWDVINNGLQAITELRAQAPALISLRRVLQEDIGLTPEQYSALYEALTKIHNISPEELCDDNVITDILKDAVKNDMYTNHYTRRLSLEDIGAERKERLNELRALNGFAELPENVHETHVAIEDSINNFILHEELVESDPAYAALVKDKHLIFVDIETQNAETAIGKNQIHSIAIVEYDSAGKMHKHISIALDPEQLKLNSEMLYKLFPDKTEAERIVAYKQLVRDQATDGLYDADGLASTAWFHLDELAQKYGKENICVIGHNIEAFDAPVLNTAVGMQDAGNSLFKYNTVDTLVYAQRKHAAGTIEYTTAQQEKIFSAIKTYAYQLQRAGVPEVFTPVMRDQMQRVNAMCTELVTKKVIKDPNQLKLITNIEPGAYKLRSTMYNIKQLNTGMKSELFLKKLFTTGPSRADANSALVKDAWISYFKELGLSAEEISARFGDTLDALTTSSVLGASSVTRALATKNMLKPDLIRQWFAVDALLVDNYIPKNLGFDMQRMATTLQRADQKFGRLINNPAFKYDINRDIYVAQATELYNIYKATNCFAELDNLINFGQLADTQKFAVVSYMLKHAEARTKKLSATEFVDPLENMSFEREVAIEFLTQPARRYSALDVFDYNELLDDAALYRTFRQSYADVADLKITLNDMTNIKDANGTIGAALAVRMRALQPLFDFTEAIGNLTKEELVSFARIDSDAAVRRSKGLVADVLHTPPKAMKARLIGSHGFICIDASQIADARMKTVFRKYDTAELRAEGVYTYLDKNTGLLWFTLDKSAGVSARIDKDLNKVSVYAHNVEVEPYVFGGTPIEKCYGAVKSKDAIHLIDTAKFAAAEQNLMRVSDNAIAGSDYTLMTSSRLKDICDKKMPPEVRAHYDAETFTKDVFFKNLTFNRSMLSISTQPLSLRLYKAAQNVMDMAKSDTLYKQCMYSDLSAIRPDTALGTAILKDPKEVAKVFRNDGSYIGASLGMRNGEAVIVKTYDLGNAADLKALVQDGGQIFDYTEYAKIYDVINNKYWTDASMTAWRTLVSVYKIGALVNPGTWTRNILDSIIKNIEATGNLNIAPYYFKAAKSLDAFDKHAAQLAKARENGLILTEADVQAYFKYCKDLSYDEYTELKQLMGIDVFGGESKIFTKLEKEHQAEQLKTWYEDGSIDARTYNKYNTSAVLRSAASTLLKPMSWTENVARYAMYYALKDQGFGINKIAKKIADTHFDYSNKSAFEHSVEGLIPFYTFQRRNLNYWLDVATEHPSFLVQLSNAMSPLIDIDQYSPEELGDDSLVQYHVLAGNIKLTDNIYINASFSFMDAFTRITDALGSLKDSVFNPLQIILDAALQGAADSAYRTDNELLSNWMQNAFGLKMTDEQIRAKYGEWTDNFYELTNYQASLGFTWEGIKQRLTKNKQWLTLIPAVGTQLYRFNKTGTFWDSGDVLNGLLNLTGLFNFISPDMQNTGAEYAAKKAQYRSWLQVFGLDMQTRDPETGKEIRTMSLNELKALYARVTDAYRKREGIDEDQPVSAIGVLLQDESNRYYYARMKSLLGYPDTKYSELPKEIKEALYFALTDQVDLSPYVPVLQDPNLMQPIWYRCAAKYNISLDNTDNMPVEDVMQMYDDIAKSVVTVGNVMSMLQDPQYRAAYSTVKDMLGLTDIKLNQIPCDVLELIETYMAGHPSGSSSKQYKRYYRSGSKVYHTMSYSPLGTPAYEMRNLNMRGTPQRNSYAANKYGVRSHQAGYRNIYQKLYTKTGKSRMELRMLPITPGNLKYRIKDYFHYF